MLAHSRWLVLMPILAAAAACHSAVSQPEQPPLRGTRWQLEIVGETTALDDRRPSLTLGEDGTISGTAGCNGFTGSYTLDGDRLTIGELALTKRLCMPRELMAQEARFLASLGAAERVELIEATLVIHCGDAHDPLRLRPISEGTD